MAVYLIGYDLIKPGKDYSKIVPEIKRAFPDYWHCLDSTWLVKTEYSAVQIRAHLAQFIDTNDRILVATIGKGAAWSVSFGNECQDWLRRNL
jgi:hypothetical protein